MANRKQEQLKVEEFMEIGGSPVPGITLRQVLHGHADRINRIAWSPDGRFLASPSDDKTIRIWDAVDGGECAAILEGHTNVVNSVAWSPNNSWLVSGSDDRTIQIWDATNWRTVKTLGGQSGGIVTVEWSHDGQLLASGSEKRITLWRTESWENIQVFDISLDTINSIAWSPDDNAIVFGGVAIGKTDSFELLNIETGNILWKITAKNHVRCVLWAPDGSQIASCSNDDMIYVVNPQTGLATNVLEGHTDYVASISFSADGRLLSSKSSDGTIRFWSTEKWLEVTKLSELTVNDTNYKCGLAFHPNLSRLATLGNGGTSIRIWDINTDVLLGNKPPTESVHYTTAKLVLVGDSGVGKTGLGWRLAKGEYKEQDSTHGQQFWVVPDLKKTREDGTECEAVLWDLAGQHIYRSIHSIFLDDVDASLVMFDPTNRQEPLKGAQFWLEQLKGKKQLPPTVLVGARLDRGAPVLSKQELDQFCQKYGISGGYIGTSAKSGEGLDQLVETLKQQIPWDEMTTTVTTVTFKRIKDFVLSLKEKPDRKGVLVRPDDLQIMLVNTDEDWNFTDAEMMTAVGHLANHGYVTLLGGSSGENYILLAPELLASVAASIFLHADKHPRELGAINETELLQGKYPIEEFKGLEKGEQQVLLDATVVRFLEHSICFRESFGNDNLLIFPSLIKQKRPLKDDVPSTDDISYVVRGRVENIYATLVVLLGYTPSFDRINQWQNQAQYETKDGNICGFRLVEDREGEIELILYYGNAMPQESRDDFQALFEQFLYQRDVEVISFPPVICPNGHRQERATVVKRSQEGKKSIFCDECGAKTTLPGAREAPIIGTSASPWLQVEESIARLRSTYETHLVRVKGYRRGWEMPRCYISRVPEQEEFAQKISQDLTDAGIYVASEPSKAVPNDVVIVLDSSAYQKAWQKRAVTLQEDLKLIQSRLTGKKLISIAVEAKTTDPHDLRGCQLGNFSDITHYSVGLFDLVLNLFAIPLNHAGFAPLRKSLHEQWERDLAGKKGKDMATALKVFISYSHKDEEFKDELVTMLAGLQRRGVIDAWQDRRIEAGDEWYQEIQDAMNDCDLAILLVSANFIASSFIQDEELTRLLQRRMEEGLRVVPIVVKPCMWQSEPIIKDIQVLPRDGEPVITFSKDTGARDQVWTDIAREIEKRAKR
jgi:small GTP-binding protein